MQALRSQVGLLSEEGVHQERSVIYMLWGVREMGLSHFVYVFVSWFPPSSHFRSA